MRTRIIAVLILSPLALYWGSLKLIADVPRTAYALSTCPTNHQA